MGSHDKIPCTVRRRRSKVVEEGHGKSYFPRGSAEDAKVEEGEGKGKHGRRRRRREDEAGKTGKSEWKMRTCALAARSQSAGSMGAHFRLGDGRSTLYGVHSIVTTPEYGIESAFIDNGWDRNWWCSNTALSSTLEPCPKPCSGPVPGLVYQA